MPNHCNGTLVACTRVVASAVHVMGRHSIRKPSEHQRVLVIECVLCNTHTLHRAALDLWRTCQGVLAARHRAATSTAVMCKCIPCLLSFSPIALDVMLDVQASVLAHVPDLCRLRLSLGSVHFTEYNLASVITGMCACSTLWHRIQASCSLVWCRLGDESHNGTSLLHLKTNGSLDGLQVCNAYRTCSVSVLG